MIRALLLTAFFCLLPPLAQAAGTDLVLVANRSSPVNQLVVLDARKLFLGIPLRAHGQPLTPVRNHTDEPTTAMFMQRVMFMSVEKYERQIQTRISRTGGSRPPAYDNLSELIGALQRDPFAITYMQRSQADSTSGLRIIGEP